MNTIIKTVATTLVLGLGVLAANSVTDASAATKRTGCVKNQTNTNQNACDTHVRRKQTATIPTTHRNSTRKFNFGSDRNLSHADMTDPGGSGGRK